MLHFICSLRESSHWSNCLSFQNTNVVFVLTHLIIIYPRKSGTWTTLNLKYPLHVGGIWSSITMQKCKKYDSSILSKNMLKYSPRATNVIVGTLPPPSNQFLPYSCLCMSDKVGLSTLKNDFIKISLILHQFLSNINLKLIFIQYNY